MSAGFPKRPRRPNAPRRQPTNDPRLSPPKSDCRGGRELLRGADHRQRLHALVRFQRVDSFANREAVCNQLPGKAISKDLEFFDAALGDGGFGLRKPALEVGQCQTLQIGR